MFTQEDIAFLAAFGDAANAHDVERIVDFYAPDAVAVSPVFGEVRGRGRNRTDMGTNFCDDARRAYKHFGRSERRSTHCSDCDNECVAAGAVTIGKNMKGRHVSREPAYQFPPKQQLGARET